MILSRFVRSVSVGFVLSLTVALQAEEVAPATAGERLPDGRLVDWCRTVDPRAAGGGVAGNTCPPEGPCDIATNRDLNIPLADQPFTTFRIKFNVFANTNGTSPVATEADVDAQLVELNLNYAPLRIRFVGSYEQINNTTYRNYSIDEDSAMKSTYADDPAHQMNVYVVNTGGFAFGTFPWDPIALTNFGGIVIDQSIFGPGDRILAHEVGHCLGLWHTHHGVSEVQDCSACYELADGSNGDTAGDFCKDTPTTPVNFGCGPPGGADCEGTPFGPTQPQNYMGYAQPICYTMFSVEQWGRMHCWSGYGVYSWVVDCNANGLDDEDDVVSGRSQDCNGNLNPDECELDCNSNAIPDSCETDFADCDGNSNPDDCDANFDGDKLIDACDDDIDNDGVANEADPCDFTPVGSAITPSGASLGDTDGDCDIDLIDYKRFRPCLSASGPGITASTSCQNLFDADDDTNIDLLDFKFHQIGFDGPQ